MKFKYSGFPERIKNFFLKTLFQKNLKKDYQEKKIRESISNFSPVDVTLVIRPDKLKEETLAFLKDKSGKLISYYFDAVGNIPEKEHRLCYFDKVFSYEEEDVDKYGLNFITNFIPLDHYIKGSDKKEVFNISSYDERFPVIEDVARQLKLQDHPYKILVRRKKDLKSNYVQVIHDYLPLSLTKQMIEEAGILLDIQKSNQKGLSFRVFEALGASKKLITTNSAIREYDFYNPDNILVIDKNNPIISKAFLEGSYVEVPEEILRKYRRKAWIKAVFEVDNN